MNSSQQCLKTSSQHLNHSAVAVVNQNKTIRIQKVHSWHESDDDFKTCLRTRHSFVWKPEFDLTLVEKKNHINSGSSFWSWMVRLLSKTTLLKDVTYTSTKQKAVSRLPNTCCMRCIYVCVYWATCLKCPLFIVVKNYEGQPHTHYWRPLFLHLFFS